MPNKKYHCEHCDIYCAKLYHYNRHLNTHKHKLKTDTEYANQYNQIRKQRTRETNRKAMAKWRAKKYGVCSGCGKVGCPKMMSNYN